MRIAVMGTGGVGGYFSLHTDLELGRPLELEALNGAVVRIGRQVGVPTPVNRVLYSLLLAHKDGPVGTKQGPTHLC